LDVGGLRIVKYLPGNGDDRGDQVGGG
jgi:hypothetical protein